MKSTDTNDSKQFSLIDTNILIDYVLMRDPFHQQARQIFMLAEKEIINIGVSMISFPTLFYLCRKTHSIELLKAISREIQKIAKIFSANEESLIWTISSNFPDLEDAIQNHIAESNGCTTIITRNKKDFKKSNLAVLTPEEFLAIQEL